MKISKKDFKKYKKIYDHYGPKAQTEKAIEELNELIESIQNEHIGLQLKELGDVFNMSIALIFKYADELGIEPKSVLKIIENSRNFKIKRQYKRMKTKKEKESIDNKSVKEYLNSIQAKIYHLDNLPKYNWNGKNTYKPNQKAILSTIDLLSQYEKFLNTNNITILPCIKIFPISSGGIQIVFVVGNMTLELEILNYSKSSLFLITNDNDYSLEDNIRFSNISTTLFPKLHNIKKLKNSKDIKVKKESFYTNKKNKNTYQIINSNICNATNKDDGNRMVFYRDIITEKIFTREYNEFLEKFEKEEDL